MITIITINYNDKEGLESTIKSVLSQTFKEFEYIIIDGGSTDGSLEVIKKYSDKINYWVSERDNGIYNAMNKGIDAAHGIYCNFMNSRDVFYENTTLEKVAPYLVGDDVVYGSVKLRNSNIIYNNKSYPDLHFFYTGSLSHQSCFIKKDLLMKYKYDENLKLVSDFKFFLQVFIKDNCSFKRLDNIICLYDQSGISSTNQKLLYKERLQVLRQMFPRIINTFEEYYNENLEQKLYIEIFHSKYHKLFYTVNVIMIKILSFFRKGANWISKYPSRLK